MNGLNSFTSLCSLRPDHGLLRTATVKTSVTLASRCTLVFLLFTFIAQGFRNQSVSLCKRKQQTEIPISSHPCAFVMLEAGICGCLQEEGKESVAYEDCLVLRMKTGYGLWANIQIHLGFVVSFHL